VQAFLLDIPTYLLSLVALYVAISCKRASSATRQEKRLSLIEETIRELSAALDGLHATLSRLRSRESMRENREKKTMAAPSEMTKQELRAQLLRGKTHAEIASMHLTGAK